MFNYFIFAAFSLLLLLPLTPSTFGGLDGRANRPANPGCFAGPGSSPTFSKFIKTGFKNLFLQANPDCSLTYTGNPSLFWFCRENLDFGRMICNIWGK